MNHSSISLLAHCCYCCCYMCFLFLLQLWLNPTTITTTTAFVVVVQQQLSPALLPPFLFTTNNEGGVTTTCRCYYPFSNKNKKRQACVSKAALVRDFSSSSCSYSCHSFKTTARSTGTLLFLSSSSSDDNNQEDQTGDEEGADLAAEFFKLAQEKGIGLEDSDMLLDEDDDDDDDDDDDEEEVGDDDGEEEGEDEDVNIPQGAINAFLGYDTGDVGEKLAGNVSLTDDQLYSEVKERVLDTAGGFVEYVKGARDDDDDDDEDDEDASKEGEEIMGKPKPYVPPETVPDSELTAGEVVLTVLEALRNNDNPTNNRGVEILFGYSSPGSQIMNEEGLTPDEYADFLRETEYKVLFDNLGISIDKGDYSFDGKKAFFTARVKTGSGPLDVVAVNFILSTTGVADDACWLVDSMLIRPQSMRRRRRR